MVSTRGVKLKFFVGERVLCYEPDPTKAKVLYDSKVLDVVPTKDSSGKKIVEYLIHFQGWNSSWDRRVGEEFVLKDTAENRQLQKDLAEKAQLQLGAYLYRKERKKHTQPKPIDRSTGGSSEDGSSGSPAQIDTDENPEMSSSSDEYSSLEDEIDIDIVPELREILEADYYLINLKNRRLKLPAEPNVVSILESYYRHYATNQFCGLNEKTSRRYRNTFQSKEPKLSTEDIQRKITLCREVIDGLRLYFDFNVNDLLLYTAEKGPGQFVTAPARMPIVDSSSIKVKCDSNVNTENNSHLLPSHQHANHHNGISELSSNPRRRTLRSNNKMESQGNGTSLLEESNGSAHPKPGSSIGSSNSDLNGPMAKALSWRLLPDIVYSQQPPPPCLVYGAIHFARLFVQLPVLFTRSSIPDAKMKVILPHVDAIIDFLNEHKEWYGEKFYVDSNQLTS